MLSKTEIKELKRLHQKKYRDNHGLFLAEGDKLVKEALRAGTDIMEIYALQGWDGQGEAEDKGIQCKIIDVKELGQICELRNPNQAIAVVRMAEKNSTPAQLTRDLSTGWSIYADRVRDPGNMGTILRIADWYGIRRVFCSNDSVDLYNQKVIQASMGAIFRTNVSYIKDEELIELASAAGSDLVATALEGKSIHIFTAGSKGVLMMGNEAQGLSDALISAAKFKVTIPGGGGAESLNVAVATGILVDWAFRGNVPKQN